jgi:hypothetical protein
LKESAVANDIPIAEQAKGGPIFDIRKGQNEVVPVPEPPTLLFPCPSCQATIRTTAQCPFCSASIDPRTIPEAAARMHRFNQACREANYLGTLAFLILLFSVVVSILGNARRAAFGQWFLLIGVPAMAIRWWVRFGAMRSDDPDFQSARRDVKLAVGIWIAFFLLVGIPAIQALLAPVMPIHH